MSNGETWVSPRGQIRAPSLRRAPEVDREWPADGPSPGPGSRPDIFPVLVMTLSVASLAVILMPGASDALRRMAVSALAGLCCAVVADEAVRWRASRPTAERALERAAWGLYFEDEPLAVIGGLRGLEMPGRAGLCLRLAVRCLERAGRCRRLERGMRRETARWVRRARGEMER